LGSSWVLTLRQRPFKELKGEKREKWQGKGKKKKRGKPPQRQKERRIDHFHDSFLAEEATFFMARKENAPKRGREAKTGRSRMSKKERRQLLKLFAAITHLVMLETNGGKQPKRK